MIKHVLSDGRKVESIEGLVIPPVGATETVYRIIAEFMQGRRPEVCQDKGGMDQCENIMTT